MSVKITKWFGGHSSAPRSRLDKMLNRLDEMLNRLDEMLSRLDEILKILRHGAEKMIISAQL